MLHDQVFIFGVNDENLREVISKSLLQKFHYIFHQLLGLQRPYQLACDLIQGVDFFQSLLGGFKQTRIFDGDGGLCSQRAEEFLLVWRE